MKMQVSNIHHHELKNYAQNGWIVHLRAAYSLQCLHRIMIARTPNSCERR